MGGDGTIGGGKSCKARFYVYDDFGPRKRAQKDYWCCDDDGVSYPFYITIDFPDGTWAYTQINEKDQWVRISWEQARPLRKAARQRIAGALPPAGAGGPGKLGKKGKAR
ncbi:MAG: hypothetical protein ACRD2Q_03925 [Terriglobales bacterium]